MYNKGHHHCSLRILFTITLLFSKMFLSGTPIKKDIQQTPPPDTIASTDIDSVIENFITSETKDNLVNLIIAEGKKLLGKPYRYRGAGKFPLDCSGFVSYIYSKHNISLPRSSRGQHQHTQIVTGNPLPGDLIFFKGRNARNKRVGHVAMIIDVKDNEITMMHSCSRGILIEKLNGNKYYEKRLIGIGRISDLGHPDPNSATEEGIASATSSLHSSESSLQ